MSKRDELAAVLEQRGETESLTWGALCLPPDVYLALADAVLAWLAEELGGDGLREAMIVPVCDAGDPNWNKGAAILERMSLDRAERVAGAALGVVREWIGGAK